MFMLKFVVTIFSLTETTTKGSHSARHQQEYQVHVALQVDKLGSALAWNPIEYPQTLFDRILRGPTDIALK